MNSKLQKILLSDKQVAINNLIKLPLKDLASQLYDLSKNYLTIQKEKKDLQESITKFKRAVTFILDQLGRKYDKEEFENVCQNEQQAILKIMNRVRQPQNNPNNPNIPPIDQQNKIDQQQNILFYENKIKQCAQHQMRLIEINEQLFQKINQKNDIQIQHQQELADKNNQLQKLVFSQQLESVNENSIKIDSDCQQFKEKIEKINQERDQIIVKMQETLEKFEQIQPQNIHLLKNGNYQNDHKECIKKFEETSQIIKLFLEKEENFEKELELNLKIENNEIIQQKIQQLLNHLKKLIEFFKYFKSILQTTLEMLNQINQVNQMQYQNNQELSKQLKLLQIENNEFNNKLQNQIRELQKSNESELNIIAKSYKKEN